MGCERTWGRVVVEEGSTRMWVLLEGEGKGRGGLEMVVGMSVGRVLGGVERRRLRRGVIDQGR